MECNTRKLEPKGVLVSTGNEKNYTGILLAYGRKQTCVAKK